MRIGEALCALGVRGDTLSREEKSCLTSNGYLLLHNMLTPAQVHDWRQWLEQRACYEREQGIEDGQREPGTERVANLLYKAPMFDVCLTHPRLLAAVALVLQGEFQSFGVSSRAALPGSGEQAYHVDFKFGAVAAGDYYRCNSAWLLDDLTDINGATRVVPGSHRSGKLPADAMPDLTQAHPCETKVLAPAGSVLVFNSHLWHSGTQNQTTEPRRVVHSFFRRLHPRETVPAKTELPPETRSRFGEAARHILNAL